MTNDPVIEHEYTLRLRCTVTADADGHADVATVGYDAEIVPDWLRDAIDAAWERFAFSDTMQTRIDRELERRREEAADEADCAEYHRSRP